MKKTKSSHPKAIVALFTAIIISLPLFAQTPPPAVKTPPAPASSSVANQPGPARTYPATKTPFSQDLLTLFSNEVSGQMAVNNLMRLAGAPWVRERKELTGTFYESQLLYDIVRGYGVETVKLERYPAATADATFDYPLEGEFWILEPEKRLIGRIGADAAIISRGSKNADITGELIYVPALTVDEAKKIREAGPQEKYQGKLALVWGLTSDMTSALDAAGLAGVVMFNAQDRYLDPDQVIYSSVSFAQAKNLQIGLAVSWRQWTELLEDVQWGRKIIVRAKAKIEKFPDRFETVHAWIPGTEPEAKGVVFTAHLFEGYLKRGANDDMSGVVVQLEILRALNKLIGEGALPKPRRTIHFLWPNEISGTYEFIKQTPGFADKLAININMDMVGEALRKNNSLFTMSECPSHLPSYYDGLAASILNYVWRTNDIVYLSDAPRNRYRGQNFPIPMWEKNGSRDAFRFFIHRATGGSDHVCFNNAAVAVPGIEYFTWPDQWYHADTDTPDKADATEIKRVAFIGATTAWASAMCADAIVADLAETVSQFGYRRMAERDFPKAFARLEAADGKTLAAETSRALNLVRFGVKREIGAIRSINEISTGSASARTAVANRISQWELYGRGLKGQVLGYAALRAKQLGAAAPGEPKAEALRAKYEKIIPAIAPAARGKEFSVARFEPYVQYMKNHPDALKGLALPPQAQSMLLNFVNGRNSIAEIAEDAAAELDLDVPIAGAAAYLEVMAAAGYVVMKK